MTSKQPLIYLFDWGDTLMVDFPGVTGKMCDWDQVEAVNGALDALSHLSRQAQIYVATGAAQSTEVEIAAALARVGLDRYIDGYFCKANLGLDKGTPAFLAAILTRLQAQPEQVTMVGDSLKKDIEPALALDIGVVWLTAGGHHPDQRVRTITSLKELCA